MNYGRIPLFPGCSGGSDCVQMALFGDERRRCGYDGCGSSCDGRCQTVRFCNPACPGEYADVQLCVDNCGNLSISVHRPGRDCCDRRRRPRC